MLRKLCLKNKSDIVLLAEPTIGFDQIHKSFWKSLGLKSFAFNDRGSRLPNLWCLCVRALDPDVFYASSQFCAFSVTMHSQKQYFAAVYASTLYQMRRERWRDLANVEHDFCNTLFSC